MYSGFHGIQLKHYSLNNCLFIDYTSSSVFREVSEEFINSNGMLLVIDSSLRKEYKMFSCDVSWISDFPKEYEVLFARGLGSQIIEKYNINESYDDSWNAQVIEIVILVNNCVL